MKRLIVLLAIILYSTTNILAQTFGNEWINYQQTYFKIPILQKGFYRITAQELAKAGVPTTIDPVALQIFRRGKEQAIIVKGEDDHKLDTTDYLDFYAEGNDGTLDSATYLPASAQLHPDYSMYADTATYFLSWRLDGQKAKRIATLQATNIGTQTVEKYHINDVFIHYYGDFAPGNSYPLGAPFSYDNPFYSHNDIGEGYTSGIVGYQRSFAVDVALPYLARNQSIITGEIKFVGRTSNIREIAVYIKNGNNQEMLTKVRLEYYDQATAIFQIPATLIPSNDMLNLSVSSLSSLSFDGFSVVTARIRYPQAFIQTNDYLKRYQTIANANNTAVIELQNFPATSRIFDVTDPENFIQLQGEQIGLNYKVIVPNANQSRKLMSHSTIVPVLSSSIKLVVFRKFDPKKAKFLIVSSAVLMRPVGSVINPVREYAAYRASAAGGSYDTLVVSMREICDLFTFGDFTPLAIRRFADYTMQKGSAEFLFLVGAAYWSNRVRGLPNRWDIDMVPIVSYPGGDIPLVQGLNNEKPNAPGIALGRLNATTPQNVLDYLNKVKEHEMAPLAIWRKNLLHLSGGKTFDEISYFKSIINDFKQVAEHGLLQGKVTTITKQTDEPVEFLNVTEQVNQGVGVITFFGHSSGTISDIDVGYVSNASLNYKNKGKYPLLIVNGCSSGNIYLGRSTFGSDWINTPDKGAVLLVAHSTTGYPTPLQSYTKNIYQILFADSTALSQPFGKVLKKAIHNFLGSSPNPYEIQHAQQIVLQGDPAIIMNPVTKPDYVLTKDGVFLLPQKGATAVTASSALFRLGVVVSNLGITPKKIVKLAVKRTLNDGSIANYGPFDVVPVALQDTLYFDINNTGIKGGGNNRFEVMIDADNRLDEMSEVNNTVLFDQPILGYAASQLLPSEFGVVNTTNPTLVAQATFALAGSNHNYLIEIDTVATFNSSFKQSKNLVSTFLLNWKPMLLPADNVVYFWRIRDADNPEDIENQWAVSSFTYLKNIAEGWSQSKNAQFLKDIFYRFSNKNERWAFDNNSLIMNLKVAGSDVPQAFQQNSLSLNNLLTVTTGNCANNALTAVSFRPVSLLPYSVLSDRLCGNPPFSTNQLSEDAIKKENILKIYLDNTTANSFVLLFSSGKLAYRSWPDSLWQPLLMLGADTAKLKKLPDGSPYLLLAQKGGKKIMEEFGTSTQTLSLTNFVLTDTYKTGNIMSTLVGPSLAWSKVYMAMQENATTRDSLEIIGISGLGNEKSLLKTEAKSEIAIQNIDTKIYPYLKIRWLSSSASGVPAQLKQWIVAYTPAPEAVLDFANKKTYTIADKQEGEDFMLTFSFKNISNRAFADSVLASYALYNSNTRKTNIQTIRLPKLAIADSLRWMIPIKTLGLAGQNILSVVFNSSLQPEQYFTNNNAEIPFSVIPDRTNPLLEVTFDSRQITNGEVVSANTQIDIRLKDENRFLLRTDTTGINLWLQRPCSACLLEKISLNSPEIRWKALSSNDFRIEYRPKTLVDGFYKLQVQGKDVSGNLAGNVPYSIDFKVINEQKIQSFFVYTPFNYAKFVLNLSGKELPNEFSIKIYDLLGHLVREFTPMPRIGTNEIVWEGTTTENQPLPNGVYVYAVQLRNNGQDIPLSRPADKLNGKIWLIR